MKIVTVLTALIMAAILSLPSFAQKKVTQAKKLMLNKIDIKEGSGFFLIEGGVGKTNKPVKVFYHRPKNYTAHSKILLVIPGAGRNGDTYRDSWIKSSEKYGVLILSPSYAEKMYGLGAYHYGGLIYDINARSCGCVKYVKGTNQVKVDEDKLKFKVNANSKQWIFNDFDRIFALVVKALGSKQKKYDAFGHSAGGQILHRMAIFHSKSKANRLLASNSGSYTLPDFDNKLFFGIKGSGISKRHLKKSFKKKLVLFLGELDNANEKGGSLLRTKTADKQGTHRFARGNYFYKYAKAKAKEMKTRFNWALKVIPGIGHNYRKMAPAAAEYLYGGNK